MLLHNPGTPLTTTQWHMLELRSERTNEETLKRLGKAIRTLFLDEEAEVFVPVIARDLDVFTLMTDSYIFIRADDVSKIAKLRRVTGIQGILAHGNATRASKFITVDDDYVQGLIKTCYEHFIARSKNIKAKSWVRILDGQCRGYCGDVLSIHDGRVLVQIQKKTKIINQETSIHNLLDMSSVPPEHRVFYYSAPVMRLLEDDPNAAEILAPDLRFNEAELKALLPHDEDLPSGVVPTDGATLKKHTGRAQTPTQFAKDMLQGGATSLPAILEAAVGAIKTGAIRCPKNCTILWHVLREAVVEFAFPGNGKLPKAERKTYKTLEHRYGVITPSGIQKLLPGLPIRPIPTSVSTHEIPTLRIPTAPPSVEAKVATTVLPELPTPTRGSQTTVTETIRAALARGDYQLHRTLTLIAQGIREGLIRAPRHTEAFAYTFRSVVRRHFSRTHPGLSVVELAEQVHAELRATPSIIRTVIPDIDDLLGSIAVAPPPISLTTTATVRDVAGIIQKNRGQHPNPLGIKTIVTTT